MTLDALLTSPDPKRREEALAEIESAPEYVRAAIAAKVAAFARDATLAVEALAPDADPEPVVAALSRAAAALAVLRSGVAKACLLRIADEGTPVVKIALARALRGTKTPEGRSVLVHLLSDEDRDARDEALLAIGSAIEAAPWPEVLPVLIEIAEPDPRVARLAADTIARCGATTGPAEACAAGDFLLEQLEDDAVLLSAVGALLRFGHGFPGIGRRARRLLDEPGRRKVAGLCLLARAGEDIRSLVEAGPGIDRDVARAFLGRFRTNEDGAVRDTIERTWTALGL